MPDKNTIMYQVMQDIDISKNSIYLEKINTLIDAIDYDEYDNYEKDLWSKNGLYISSTKTSHTNTYENYNLVSEYEYEYSWLVSELVYIYKPKKSTLTRLLTTIGYLLETYEEKYDDLDIILKMTATYSTIWLHPDHIGFDSFIVYPNNLPPFGDLY